MSCILTMKHPKTYDRMALAKIRANPLMKRAMDFKRN